MGCNCCKSIIVEDGINVEGRNFLSKTNLINEWNKQGEGYFLREINKRGGWDFCVEGG